MAPGFFHKLGEFVKKAWKGIRTGAKFTKEKILPWLNPAGKAASKLLREAGPVGQGIATGIDTGLGVLNPLIDKIV